MKIWLSKNSEVSIREQLFAQIQIGIASDDLVPGEKLPSIRQLARRFGVHPNTISAAYGELADAGLIEFRKGSGSFVKAQPDSAERTAIDAVVDEMLVAAAAHGFTAEQVYSEIGKRLSAKGTRAVCVIEPDEGLREIIIAEVAERLGAICIPVTNEDILNGNAANLLIAAMYDEKPKLENIRADGRRFVFLKANSVSASMMGRMRPRDGELLAVVSGWRDFLAFSRLYLTAARVDPETIMFRSTSEPSWRRGTDSASILICDAVSARHFTGDSRVIVFQLISEASIAELRAALASD